MSVRMLSSRMVCVMSVCLLGLSGTSFGEHHEKDEKPTPPTKVDEWGLESDFEKIHQQWESMEAVLTDEKYFAIQNEDVSGWSCGKQAGHLALARGTIGDSIDNMLKNPK